ncbi:MAG TPA: response regulator [Nitrospira sp.]|nr:response regulator [Nitrospira sp.]
MSLVHLLIVDDDPFDVEVMLRELKKSGFDPLHERVDTREAFIQRLELGQPDLILYDYNVPQFSSLEALQLTQGGGRDIPFLIVSHAMQDEEAVALMRAGAADYLLKDRLGRLGEAVRHALEQRRLRREHADARESLVALNADLERRIVSRTEELRLANQALEAELRQRAEAEDALRRLNADLERRVVERTRDLAESNRRLQALATELTLAEQRERKRLAAELHDYLAQMLALGRMKTTQLRQKLGGAPSGAQQLAGEVDELFQRAGEYTRTLMAKLNPPALEDLGLAAALAWFAKQKPLHGLNIDIRATPQPVPLPDEQAVLLFQSVRELLINVAKHAQSDEALVSIHVDDEHRLCVEVRDHGRGFDPGRVRTSDADSHFGLLSIHERMRAMGGRLDLDSAPGRGTKATLVLPLKTAEETGLLNPEVGMPGPDRSEPGTPRVHSGTRPPTRPSQRIRILLVDDHVMVRQGLRGLLETYPDMEIVGEAANGEEAIAAIAKWQPDVVVMDIHMPRLSGIDATARIKSRHPGTIIIGLSIQSFDETQEAMTNAGASLLISKDAVADELYAGIQSAVTGKCRQ